MLAFVSHVLMISATSPSAKIKNICLNEFGSPVTMKNAGRTAANAVKDIKSPVLKAP